MIFLVVPPSDRPLPAIEVLLRQLPDLPQGYLAQLLRQGKFRTPSAPLAAATPLAGGTPVLLPGGEAFRARVAAGSPPLLFESESALVVGKPSGLAVHAGVGHRDDNLLRRLAATFRRRGAPYRLHPVHRLDRETSGALLIAKGRRAAGTFGRQLMQGEIGKTYLAVVQGFPGDKGTLDAPLEKRGALREARTDFRTLARFATASLLEIELHSGRTHQIRRQLADAGHPLVGDRRYGGSTLAGLSRLFLHCHQLSLPPADDCPGISIDSPLPEDLGQTLAALGLHWPKTAPSVNSTVRTRHTTAG